MPAYVGQVWRVLVEGIGLERMLPEPAPVTIALFPFTLKGVGCSDSLIC